MPAKLSLQAHTAFQRRLLAWFRGHCRDLPWRASRDPYRVWVAEIMLQQTRIAAVLPYYQRFLERFPDVHSLANSPEEDVLRLWSGLGYYSRARNLRRAAGEVAARHGDAFPRSFAKALALPGVGSYTAAAVLSIAYGLPHAVLDGNVARVLARLYAMRGDLREPRRWKRLERAAGKLLAPKDSGAWNQALMELGETVCTPFAPRCEACPVSRWCAAYSHGLTSQIPAPRRKRAAVQICVAAAILRDPAGRTLLVRDPGAHDDVLFSRMWQFPAVEVTQAEPQGAEADLRAHLANDLKLDLSKACFTPLAAARHGITFRNITLLPFLANVPRLPKLARSKILPLADLRRLPVSSATRKIAAAVTSFASGETHVRPKPSRGC